jgi:hypothetical protein
VATTAVQICNTALLRVGHRQLISDLDEATTEAQACNALYAAKLDEVLAEAPWRWATARAALAALATVTRSTWAYVYALPTDCVTPRYLVPAGAVPAAPLLTTPWHFPSNSYVDGTFTVGLGARVPFGTEYDATYGALLVSNMDAAELVYTARVTVVPRFPPLFVDALAWKLAAELALALSVKPQVGLAMDQRYQQAVARAAAADANQGQADVMPDAEHIRAR